MLDSTRYLNEAPDHAYLATKVLLILGITGACRREELCELTVNDIRDEGTVLKIKTPDTKTHRPRTFTVEGKFRDIVNKYSALRPSGVKTNRFFLNFQRGKCTSQPIGINKFGIMPKQITEYLGLSDPKLYTGHSFRRTSTTLLADSGASLTQIKRHGGWKSVQVAESYIEDSINNKRKVCQQITDSIQPSFSNPIMLPVMECNKASCSKSIASSVTDSIMPPATDSIMPSDSDEDFPSEAPSPKRLKTGPGACVRAPLCENNDSESSENRKPSPRSTLPGQTFSLSIHNCPGL